MLQAFEKDLIGKAILSPLRTGIRAYGFHFRNMAPIFLQGGSSEIRIANRNSNHIIPFIFRLF
jgi:hypothetical protein